MIAKLSKLPKIGLQVLTKKRFPLRVSYFCTFHCNLRCRYCGLWKTKMDEMTTEQAKRMITEFSDAGTAFFMFTGGEPLMREDIGELVDLARERGMAVGLVTNGILLNERLNDIKNLNYLVVSLDGPKEINDKIRGKGSFNKAINGIKSAKKMGLIVMINAVISKMNIQDDYKGIIELLRITEALDCEVNFSVFYRDKFNENCETTFETTRAELNRTLDFIKNQKKIRKISLSESCIGILKGETKTRCYAGKLFCDVLPDGTVTPCIFKEGTNGIEHGFLKAFGMLPEVGICCCTNTCYSELNATLSLKPKALSNAIKNYSRHL